MSQYTTLIIHSLKNIRDGFPDLTFGEILYSVMRKNNMPEKPDNVNTSWLLELTDEQIYNAFETTLKSLKNELSESEDQRIIKSNLRIER